jgi:hypothetical protein
MDYKELRENIQSPEVFRENLAYFNLSLFKTHKMVWHFYKKFKLMPAI